MKTGFICRPSRLRFVGDPREIPAYYYEQGKNLQKADEEGKGIFSEGCMKTVVTSTYEEAEKVIPRLVGEALRACGWYSDKMKPSNFRFDIAFSEVKNGEFWPRLSHSRCGEYMPE